VLLRESYADHIFREPRERYNLYHGLMDKDVVELMKLHEELANIRHGQKINSGQRQAQG
jgi:hypothetical protein